MLASFHFRYRAAFWRNNCVEIVGAYWFTGTESNACSFLQGQFFSLTVELNLNKNKVIFRLRATKNLAGLKVICGEWRPVLDATDTWDGLYVLNLTSSKFPSLYVLMDFQVFRISWCLEKQFLWIYFDQHHWAKL